jgi:DNA-binding GntR family transcriptional regulator
MVSKQGERRVDKSSVAAVSLSSYLRLAPEHGSSTDAVADALREAILEGAIPPGTWLREDGIARELGVSRTPVREALRRVADEGLVTKTAHSGSIVASLSFDDILALYVVRGDLEALAARLAAQRCPDGLVEDLERIHEKMIACTARGELAALPDLNLEFHRKLRLAAGNSYLERFLLQVEHAVRRLRESTLSSPSRAEESLLEHRAVIEAIARQDPEAAAKAAHTHMLHARDARIRAMLPSSLGVG